jgi:hypothetical protein
MSLCGNAKNRLNSSLSSFCAGNGTNLFFSLSCCCQIPKTLHCRIGYLCLILCDIFCRAYYPFVSSMLNCMDNIALILAFHLRWIDVVLRRGYIHVGLSIKHGSKTSAKGRFCSGCAVSASSTNTPIAAPLSDVDMAPLPPFVVVFVVLSATAGL